MREEDSGGKELGLPRTQVEARGLVKEEKLRLGTGNKKAVLGSHIALLLTVWWQAAYLLVNGKLLSHYDRDASGRLKSANVRCPPSTHDVRCQNYCDYFATEIQVHYGPITPIIISDIRSLIIPSVALQYLTMVPRT